MQFRKSFIIFSICTFLACGTAAQAGYIDNGDGTVTDTGTGLMWQQSRAPSTYTWELALNYCENLILNNDGQWTVGTGNASGAKHSDWRLPTAKELESIVDTTRYDPTINTLYFPPIPCHTVTGRLLRFRTIQAGPGPFPSMTAFCTTAVRATAYMFARCAQNSPGHLIM